MPWTPTWTSLVLDARLDPYRGRGGSVTDDVGHAQLRVYVEVSSVAQRISGRLWWRPWSPPHEFVILHLLAPDGIHDEAWLHGAALDEELTDWGAGVFRHAGRELSLRWMGAEESASLKGELGVAS